MSRFRKFHGFTLIELLIVVAIIAILAAIAVPNFLEAQVRAKNSRGKADMRSLATAIEAYRADSGKYPMDPIFYNSIWNGGGKKWPGGGTMSQKEVDNYMVLQRITTPIAYMASTPNNVYGNHTFANAYVGTPAYWWYVYWGAEWKQNMMDFYPNNPKYKDRGAIWSVSSTGPDRVDNLGGYLIFGEETLNATTGLGLAGCLYDPTNGTMSAGDVVRIGP
ncbi:MAG: prepilin-type N-terminal cleavage/methylation domain-containing protein [bacterium]